MTHVRNLFAGAAAFALTLAASTSAQPQSAPPPSPANQFLLSMMPQNMALERYLDHLRSLFRQSDADSDGQVGPADVALHAAIGGAGLRMSMMSFIIRADLDGDGDTTEDELRRMFRYDRRMDPPRQAADPARPDLTETEVRRLMAADTNHDGRISLAEALAFTKTQPDVLRGAAQLSNLANRLLVLVSDGKTTVTFADIEPAAEALFRTVDTDGNGTVTMEELRAYRQRPDQPEGQRRIAAEKAMQEREAARRKADAERVRKEEETNAACAMPKASDAAKMVMIGTYQTQSISTTTIGFQDVAVGVGNITIEPGNEPVYLIVSAFRPTIWRFSGAVERLERVVLSSTMTGGGRGLPNEKPLVGATGLPAERITFLGQSRCLSYFSETPSTQAAQAAAVVRRQAGKEVALVTSQYGMNSVSVPSGQVQSIRDGNEGKLVIVKPSGSLRIEGDASNYIVQAGPSNLISDLRMYSPGGVISIDPAKVVSSLPAEAYVVLPQQAGLLQLVQAGALEQNRSGEYMIKKKLRFPPELNGGHSVKFLLLRGVPMPDGDPGHSDVISEETGEKLKFGGR